MTVWELLLSLPYDVARRGEHCPKEQVRSIDKVHLGLGHRPGKGRLCRRGSVPILRVTLAKGRCSMNVDRWTSKLRVVAWMFAAPLLLFPCMAVAKNMAVIATAGSKLQDVPLAEMAKLCKGSQKTWPDGRNFTLIMKDPESPDMRIVAQKLFGMAPAELKAA